MSRPTDEQIVTQYVFRGESRLDSNEEIVERLDCGRCGMHTTTPGTSAFDWVRQPLASASGLPMTLQLCRACQEQILEVRAIMGN